MWKKSGSEGQTLTPKFDQIFFKMLMFINVLKYILHNPIFKIITQYFKLLKFDIEFYFSENLFYWVKFYPVKNLKIKN